MKAMVSWKIEKRLVFIQMGAAVNLGEVRQMNADIKALLDLGNPPVHIIFDAQVMTVHPSTILELVEILDFLKHPKLGWNMTIPPNALVSFLGTVVNGLTGAKQFAYVKTVEEALERLYRLDSSLKP